MLGSSNDDEGVGAVGEGGGGTALPDSLGGRAASSALSLVPQVPDPLIISVFNIRGGCYMRSPGYLQLCTILAMTLQANHADFSTWPHPKSDDDMLSDKDTEDEEDRWISALD
jgi:hypothetical protein